MSPELPEYVWDHTKYGGLANYIPEDLTDLRVELDESMVQTRRRPKLLMLISFFPGTELEL